jgi:hypothetical protein
MIYLKFQYWVIGMYKKIDNYRYIDIPQQPKCDVCVSVQTGLFYGQIHNVMCVLACKQALTG